MKPPENFQVKNLLQTAEGPVHLSVKLHSAAVISTTWCRPGQGENIQAESTSAEGATAEQFEKWARDYSNGRFYSPPFQYRLDVTGFRERIYRSLAESEPGELMTYSELAALAGSPRASRAVGTAMKQNPLPLVIPCHRVIAADGPGGYSAGMDIKYRLLELEGSIIED